MNFDPFAVATGGIKFDVSRLADNQSSRPKRISLSQSEVRERVAYYKSEAGIELTDEHIDIFESIFCDHSNVFITGGAGVGKTTFVKHILIPEFDYRGTNAYVTASTGIAGSHLKGKTIHSWAGIRTGPVFSSYNTPPADMTEEQARAVYLRTYSAWSTAKDNMSKAREGVKARIRSTEALILDEVSMIAGVGLLGYLDFFFRTVRDKDEPFGGIQMIFIGDMAQLPPVDRHNGSRPDWAFLSPSWERAEIRTVELTKVFRQADEKFANFLNRRRVGEPLLAEEREYVSRFVRPQTEDDVRRASFLVSTNKEADSINQLALDWYEGPTVTLEGEMILSPVKALKDWETPQNLKEKIIGNKPVREILNLRPGMPVLFSVNDFQGQYVNGTKGFFEGMIGPAMIVRIPATHDQEEVRVKLERMSFCLDNENGTSQDDRSLEHRYVQYPVIPATAITIHKCVDKNTLLPTSSGLLTIDEVCTSPQMPEVCGLTEFKSTCEPFVGVSEAGLRITTRRGYQLTCSVRHPLMRTDGCGMEWVLAPDLRVGDALRMRGNTQAFGDGSLPPISVEIGKKSKPCQFPSVISNDLAWLLGMLVGDGCQSDQRDARVDVTSMDPCVVRRFVKIMWSEFGLKASIKSKSKTKAKTAYVHSWPVRNWLLSIGLSYATAREKCVPHVILKGTKSQQQSFIQGYFDADGGVNSCVHVTSASEKLLREVHVMLLNLGIIGTLGRMKDAWRINITGPDVKKFELSVGFSIQRKAKALTVKTRRSQKVPKVQAGFYPADLGAKLAKTWQQSLRTVYPHVRGVGFGEFSHWARFLSRVANASCGLSDAHLAAMQRDLPLCKTVSNSFGALFEEAEHGCFLDEIAAIETVDGDMRDICVPDGHAFVGNGFVNHNSQGISLDDCTINLSRSFAPGHVYVAMSRLRSPEGLTLTSTDFDVIVDPHVMEFYRKVRSQPKHRNGREIPST
jgi:hypothetical protein